MDELESIRVLLVDDNPDDRYLVKRELKKACDIDKIIEVADEESFIHVLKEGDFDVVITDYQLMWSNGIYVLKEIKKNYPNCPVIMFTGTGSEEIAVEAMKEGLDDYILKSSKHFIRLSTAVRRAVERSEIKNKQEKIEIELKESEEKYRAIVERSHDAIYIYKGNKFIFVNDRVSEITGYSKEELYEMDVFDLIHPDDRERIKEFGMKRQSDLTAPTKYEAKILRKDGETRICKFSVTLITYKGEKAVLGAASDITEEKKREKELKESQEKYRTLFEASPEAIVVLSTDGKIIDCNTITVKLSQKDKAELLGKSYFELEFFDEDDLPHLEELFDRVLNGEQIGTIELIITIKGEKRWIELYPAPLTKNESVYAVQVIIRDITERKKSEEALRESEAKLRGTFRAAPIGIGLISNRVFEYVNDKFCEMLGYSKDELIGRDARMIYPGDEEYEYVDRVKYKQIKEKGIGSVETRFRKKDGKIIDVILSTSPVDSADLSKGMIFTVMDVTESKKARLKLEESERKYRTTFEHTGTAMVMIEEDTTLSLVNSEFEKLSGYPREEIEGKMSWTQFVYPDDLERMKGYHYARRRNEEAPKRYEFRFIDRNGNIKNIFLAIDLIPGTKKTVASLSDITPIKRLNNLLRAISEINELVAREKSPEFVLKTVCTKLNLVYDAVFTSLRVNGDLVPVESMGINIRSIRGAVRHCPSIQTALNGDTGKLRVDDEMCKHCTKTPHKYVLSIPLIHNKHHGVITIHSSTDFNGDEIKLLEKLSSNIAFALSAYEIEADRREAFEQLAANLMQFEHSADRLRNPLAAIIGSLELKDELGNDRVMDIINEQAEKIKKELDEMRREEVKTFKMIKRI